MATYKDTDFDAVYKVGDAITTTEFGMSNIIVQEGNNEECTDCGTLIGNNELSFRYTFKDTASAPEEIILCKDCLNG